MVGEPFACQTDTAFCACPSSLTHDVHSQFSPFHLSSSSSFPSTSRSYCRYNLDHRVWPSSTSPIARMASSSRSQRVPKLPVAQLTILSICRFAEPVALTSVFPYLPEMIESFGIPRDEVAKWAGITSGVFSISQCLTAISWGRASDKVRETVSSTSCSLT